MSDSNDAPENLAEGSLVSHLIELRDRLLRALLAVFVVFIPCAIFSNELFTFIAVPLTKRLPIGTSMIATDVMAPFAAPLKLALLTSIFLSMPFILYQIWAFVSPGLYRKEKRFAVPLLLSSIVLFYAGAAFAYFVVFDLMFTFLINSGPDIIKIMPDMSDYLDSVIKFLFAFGLAFEIPIATVLLAASGMVKVESMAKHRSYVLLAIFVVAAFLTPPDALSQTMMAVPMYLLFESGILLSKILLKEKLAAARAEEEHGAS